MKNYTLFSIKDKTNYEFSIKVKVNRYGYGTYEVYQNNDCMYRSPNVILAISEFWQLVDRNARGIY